MKLQDIKPLEEGNHPPLYDKNGLDSNGYSKEMFNHIQEVIKGPFHGPMSSDDIDKLLGI